MPEREVGIPLKGVDFEFLSFRIIEQQAARKMAVKQLRVKREGFVSTMGQGRFMFAINAFSMGRVVDFLVRSAISCSMSRPVLLVLYIVMLCIFRAKKHCNGSCIAQPGSFILKRRAHSYVGHPLPNVLGIVSEYDVQCGLFAESDVL